ncbi:glycosyltransferase family 4 protein [uncultured Bacteroides sp.]|uniref:glycosyltransferase family 4 protein n=1 Tax=uncultured Bacteroides sp. TaxID=162156 RepID=UPI002626DECD|nr:glycosyltransferase family 4 protein [uncultured Bacteroides sp.]
MRLLYIDPQSAYNLAQYDYSLLSNMDVDITYCCSIKYDAPSIVGVDYRFVFNYAKYKWRIFKAFSYILSILRVIAIVREIRPDVIHIQWWRLWIVDYVALYFYKRYCNCVVFTAHNVMPHDSGLRYKKKCSDYYNRVDKLIVHVNRTKEQLVKDFCIPAEKIFVIPHGVLNNTVDNSAVGRYEEELEIKYNVKSKIVFSLLGYQSLYKGTDILKSVLERSKQLKNNSHILFIIAGKGDIITPEMMNEYDNVLVINSFIPSEQLEAIMRVTDVQLLPYRVISQSGILLSTINKEIPYISTDVGGLSEPMSIAPIGWLISLDSVDELCSLLESLSSHPEEIQRKRNGHEGWKSVKLHYEWKEIGRKTMDCYNLILS